MRQDNWKQDNPPDQAIAILSGIEGWLDNIQDGTTPAERGISIILKGLEDLKLLHKEYLHKEW